METPSADSKGTRERQAELKPRVDEKGYRIQNPRKSQDRVPVQEPASVPTRPARNMGKTLLKVALGGSAAGAVGGAAAASWLPFSEYFTQVRPDLLTHWIA